MKAKYLIFALALIALATADSLKLDSKHDQDKVSKHIN